MKTLVSIRLKSGASISLRDIQSIDDLIERQLVITPAPGEDALFCDSIIFDPTDAEACRWSQYHMTQSLSRAVAAINA